MPVIRWNPERSIFSLKSDMDRLFDNFLQTDPVNFNLIQI